ncbi:hypothetical protein D918_02129 [Trichuris suis]|nr:hypothetical protein D918_02129 [Trichuris suis]
MISLPVTSDGKLYLKEFVVTALRSRKQEHEQTGESRGECLAGIMHPQSMDCMWHKSRRSGIHKPAKERDRFLESHLENAFTRIGMDHASFFKVR